MHQSFFRPNYIFNNDAYFFRFSRTKIPFDHFLCKFLLTSKALHFGVVNYENNIKKAYAKFREDLLYFQHFMLIFVFAPN